ncbi:uncharacterized protein VTP21DRAFT_10111 [Calcarisporiella thermophila]|uniref:uncharacterized protein n=1 Tax=Calcarisporiella thermophila TaxID=911321 RepID=UPI003743F6B2
MIRIHHLNASISRCRANALRAAPYLYSRASALSAAGIPPHFRVLQTSRIKFDTRLTGLYQIRFHGSHGHHHHHHHHQEPEILSALANTQSRGARITIIGMAANVGLSVTKGIAGWLMNSASLLADAAHSMTDMLSDIVTLYTYKIAQKPPDSTHPFGYGKYETIGTLAVSGFLILGAIAIGKHSLELLMAVVGPEATSASEATAEVPISDVAEAAAAMHHSASPHLHSHSHSHALLNPHAAWFALSSVIIKEWLYRATLKIGLDEKSDVLIANAWHHRSDAFSSLVALGAITGSYLGIPILDPVGGLVVSGMIAKSGADIMLSSLRELVDANVADDVVMHASNAVKKIKEGNPDIIAFERLRARKSGRFVMIDLSLEIKGSISLAEAMELEHAVRSAILNDPECKQVKEVLVHFDPKHRAVLEDI